MADGGVEALLVPPVEPGQGGQLELVDGIEYPIPSDAFGPLRPDDARRDVVGKEPDGLPSDVKVATIDDLAAAVGRSSGSAPRTHPRRLDQAPVVGRTSKEGKPLTMLSVCVASRVASGE